MKIGFVVLGGVDRGGEYRVTPCLLWLLERLAREHEVHVYALQQYPPVRAVTTCLAHMFRTPEEGPAGLEHWRKSSPSIAAHRSMFCTRFRLLPWA